MKMIRRMLNVLYKAYSRMFDKIVNALLGIDEPHRWENIYCNSDYYMTPGGTIRRDE